MVLEQARETVARGWVQDRWYTVPRRPQDGTIRQLVAGDPSPREVHRACLAGAVALSVRQRNSRADIAADGGPAIDYVWDAVQQTSERGLSAVAGRAWPRDARLARIRDITRWNDTAGRTRDDVLAVLDIAISRVI